MVLVGELELAAMGPHFTFLEINQGGVKAAKLTDKVAPFDC